MTTLEKKREERATNDAFHISMEAKDLHQAVKVASRVSSPRSTIPILAYVRLTVIGADVAVTGADMETYITAKVKHNDQAAQGDITLPSRELCRVLSLLHTGAYVDIRGKGDSVVLTSGEFQAELMTLPAADFPTAKEMALTHRFTLERYDLFKLINKVRFAISTEETRYYLNGIYLHSAGDKLRAVATDGHRMALCDIDRPKVRAEHKAGPMPALIIPRAVANMLKHVLPKGDVDVNIGPSGLTFASGGITVWSKAIDGKYPDYDRVIPDDNDKKIILDKDGFRRALNRVTALRMEKSSPVKFEISQDRMVLHAYSCEAGRASEKLMISYSGATFEVGFQARYVRAIVDVLGGRMEMAFRDATGPAIFTDPDDAAVKFILMPMRV